MCNSTKLLTAGIIIIGLLAANALGITQNQFNYQGRLTDTAGEPVDDGDYQIIFTIYDESGVNRWTSGEQTVPVSTGLFHYILGSAVSIPDSVFKMPYLYLGIKIGEDPEISPKTLLTSSPGAAVAANLSGGSIETDSGSVVFKSIDGDSALVFMGDIDSHRLVIHPPDPTVPPDPAVPAVEIYANNENRIDVYYPNGDADEGIVQLGANPTQGGYISLHAAQPLTTTRIMMGGSATDTGFVALYGGDNGSEYKLLELTSRTSAGGKVTFFDEAASQRELLTINGSPEAGIGIVGFNPQPEPPGYPAFELGINAARNGPGSYFRLNNPTSEYLDEPSFEVSTNSIGGLDMLFFNPQPEPPGRTDMSMGTGVSGPEILMFNPQPEPPGQMALEMATASRGAGGYVSAYNHTDSVRTVLAGGNISLYDMADTDGTNAGFGIQPSASRMALAGPQPPIGDSRSVISMLADSSGAYVSIGTDSTPEALTVMGNGWFSGEIFYYTDTKGKKNIQPINNALELVSRMNGYYYDCRTEEYFSLRLPESRQVGFLAQEVKEVVPEIVSENEYGLTGVDYSRITALLVEAVKELKIENEKQAELIEQLREEINRLK
jgi:hypothetical protein